MLFNQLLKKEKKKENTHVKAKVFHHGGGKPNSTRPGKREFDRHSGTGRGKEVSKNGAGGKTVWGSDQMVAKEETERYYQKKNKRDYDNDDFYYNEALNKKETKVEEKVEAKEEVKAEVAEVAENGEAKVEAVEEPKEEHERKERKPRKGDKEEESVKKEESLWTPDSVDLSTYKQQQMEKNASLNNRKKVEVKKDFSALDSMKEMKDESDSLTIQVGKKKEKKVAPKVVQAETKSDIQERDLNANMGFKVETANDFERRDYGNKRGGRGGRPQNNRNVEASSGFKFSDEDFPALK